MLDTQSLESHWDDWKTQEWKLLQYKYFLWNQRIISTEDKPFLVTQGTKILIWEVLIWESIDVSVENYRCKVTDLIIHYSWIKLPYKSGEEERVYSVNWWTRKNFLSSWFNEVS